MFILSQICQHYKVYPGKHKQWQVYPLGRSGKSKHCKVLVPENITTVRIHIFKEVNKLALSWEQQPTLPGLPGGKQTKQ